MIDYLMQCAASNWCISSVLAGLAWFAQARLRSPMIAHLLWLLVLIKLVTPPLLLLPVLPALGEAATGAEAAAAPLVAMPPAAPASATATPDWLTTTNCVLLVWLAGSLAVLLFSTWRIARFHRLLTLASCRAPRALQSVADRLAPAIGLRAAPEVWTTSARVSPMVWWVGGKVRIFVPEQMPAELGGTKMRWILAHELGHVRRRDHLVRWLEWLACVAFWWNPIAWIARRNLRANEEVCCDALVLRSLAAKPHAYANSLLAAVEFLAAPGLRPPAMASEINSGGFLERRFRMIVSKTPVASTPRWLQGVLAVGIAALMPLGVAYAQNPDVKAVTQRLRKAVQAGEITKGEARVMLGALKKTAAKKAKGAAEAKATDKTAKEYFERAKADYAEAKVTLKKRLERAIESGRVSEENAKRLYEKRLSDLEARAKDLANSREVRRATLEREYAKKAARGSERAARSARQLQEAYDLSEQSLSEEARLDRALQKQRVEHMRAVEAELQAWQRSRPQAANDAKAKSSNEQKALHEQLLEMQRSLEKNSAIQQALTRQLERLQRDTELRVRDIQNAQKKREAELNQIRQRIRSEATDRPQRQARTSTKKVRWETETRRDPASTETSIKELTLKLKEMAAQGKITTEQARAKAIALKKELAAKRKLEKAKKGRSKIR